MAKRAPNRLLTDAFREIKNTRSRFISLMILSALAVCFLAGLRATAPDMKNSADIYLDQQKLMDMRIVSTLGLTEKDAKALSQHPGVVALERAYSVDAILSLPENDYILKALSYSPEPGLNAPKLVEGRLPEKADECVVEPLLLEQTGLKIGDSITLDTGTGDFEDALPSPTFTIVGTVNSPLYVGVERGSSTLGTGKVSAFLLLPVEAFDMETYTDFYLQVEGAEELLCYSDAYTDLMDEFEAGLEPLAEERAKLRGDEIRDEANEKLAEAEQELADAEEEANQEIADAQAELDDARKELDDGWAEYYDGERELNQEVADANREIADAEQELADALVELNDGEQELIDARKELDDGWVEYNDGLADYQEGLAEYYDGLAEFEDGKKKYEEGLEEYYDGVEELEDAKKEVKDGWRQYYSGQAQLSAGAQELAAGKQQLQEQEKVFQNGLTEFRESLTDPLPAYAAMTNNELLAAMATPEGANTINGFLEASRLQVSEGMALLNGTIDDLQQKLNTAKNAVETLPGTIDKLETQTIPYLNNEIDTIQSSINAETDEEKKAELTAKKSALEEQLAQANLGLEEAKTGLSTAQAAIPQLEAGLQETKLQKQQLELMQQSLYTKDASGNTIPISTAVFLSGKQQIDAGWRQIAAGEAELDAGAEALSDARRQLRDAEKQIAEGEEELAEGWAELEDARLEIEDAQQELDDGWAELEDGRIELEDALQKLNDGEQELIDGRKELDDGWVEYNDGLAELADAKQTLKKEVADARAELADGLAELQDGEAEYADGLKEFEEGKAEAEEKIADAHKELEQARRDIAELEDCEWYLLGRNTNMGYMSYSMDADRMGNLASVFPLIFFLVAALVCLTTMTRMVEEQRITIGGLKALGYSKGAIAIKYVGYGFLASAIGAFIGLALGLTLIPWIICNAWNIIYQLGPVHYGLEPLTSGFACAAAIGTVTLAALGACFSTLAAVPAQLMRPKAPPMGKRVLLERLPFIWNRLSFNYKITIRNLFRYKKRFWMTVIGIGGCAALIITAFGLRDSIFDVMDKQFDEIYTYSTQIGLVDKVTPGELREVERALDNSDLVERWLACRSESVTTETDAYTVDGTLQVFADQDAVAPFIDLRHRTNSNEVVLPHDGVVLTEKLAKLLDVKAGDTFILDGEKRVEVRVADITEHYIQHYIYMTAEYYQTLFEMECENNLVLVHYPVDAQGVEALETELVSLDGVTSLSRVSDTRNTFTSSLAAVDYAVLLIIVCAAALAFVVLYNLTNINITERMRELATLKVLGFYDGELSAYVYRENVILTVFGVAMGMLMGKLLHQWLILTVEIDLLMFGRVLAPTSYLYSVILTVIFSLLVNLSAHKKLKKLDMVESLKTVE